MLYMIYYENNNLMSGYVGRKGTRDWSKNKKDDES